MSNFIIPEEIAIAIGSKRVPALHCVREYRKQILFISIFRNPTVINLRLGFKRSKYVSHIGGENFISTTK